jgi:hypothetical protein
VIAGIYLSKVSCQTLPENTFCQIWKKIIFKRDLLEKWAEKLILSEPELGNGSTISINPIYYLNREFYCLLNRKRLYYFEI